MFSPEQSHTTTIPPLNSQTGNSVRLKLAKTLIAQGALEIRRHSAELLNSNSERLREISTDLHRIIVLLEEVRS